MRNKTTVAFINNYIKVENKLIYFYYMHIEHTTA
jgi:hypothetical protein